MLIGDTVIQASNAKTPEFISASVIESSLISGWNGRPVVPYHPRRNGKAVSANDPEIYDAIRTGTLFNTKWEDNKLKSEAWIDIDRCKDLDKETVEKLTIGEFAGVSVGAIVETEKKDGESSGDKYGAVWLSIDGDHLALSSSLEGACNQEMGCKAGITAAESKENNVPIVNAEEPKIAPGFFARLLSKFRPSAIFDSGESEDEAIRGLLETAIKALEPSFDWICDVGRNTGAVVYMTFEGVAYRGTYKYFRRTYTTGEGDSSVTLSSERLEVVPARVWKTVDQTVTVSDESIETVTGAGKTCGCQDNQSQTPAEGVMTMSVASVSEDRKKNVNDLIAAGKFTEADRPCLEGASEGVFKSLSGGVEAQAEVERLKAAAATPSVITEEQALAACPSLKSMVDQHRAAEEVQKSSLVARLVGAQDVHDEASLKSLSLDRLQEIAALLKLDSPQVDFSLRGVSTVPSETRAASVAPDGWLQALNGRESAVSN